MTKNLQLKLHLKSFHPFYLDKFVMSTHQELKKIAISSFKHVFLPRKTEKFTVLRSPHVDKKARDQFERVIHKRLIILQIPVKDFSNWALFYRVLRLFSFLAVGIEMRVEYSFVTKKSV